MLTLWTTLAAGLLLASCGEAAAPAGGNGRPEDRWERPTRVLVRSRADLPLLDTDDPRPLVEVDFPGLGKAVWLVDTGAAVSWVSRQFTERHGIERHPLGATVVDIHGERSGISERIFVDVLQVGDVRVTDFKPPVLDALYGDIDGSLGQDILRTAFVVLDGPGRTLSLLPKDSGTDVLADFGMGGRHAIAYRLDWSHDVPVFTTSVKGLEEPVAFLVDTGTGRMTLPPDVIARLGLEQVGTEPSRAVSDLGGASRELPVYDVPRLELDLFWVTDEAIPTPQASLGWGTWRKALLAFDNVQDIVLFLLEE